ncbi:hypothetical protein MNBD_NITROSPIRAE01-77 [hydrothermal vent metagenome]|uniref:Uncharacterized protein n=1 Tax=hydrothermal vent metagenome TaxID=652676 RepID=A0A3B1CHB6_9ZZZZ
MVFFLIAIWALSIVFLAGYLWLIILAFKKSTAWGLAVFFIPFVSLYFSIKFWAETKKPFLMHSSAFVGLIVVSVASVFFATGEGQMGESNVKLARPAMQEVPEAAQRTLSQEDQMALVFMEKTIELMERLPRDEKQQEILKVMRKFIRFQKMGFSAEEVRQYSAEIEIVLNRRDLNKKQRESIEKILADVRKIEEPLAVVLSPSLGTKGKVDEVDTVVPLVSSVGEESPSSLRTLAEEKHRVALRPGVSKLREKGDVFERVDRPVRYRRTSFVQAKNHIGSAVRFVDPWGEEKDCILVKIAEKSLHCRKQFSSGSFSFSYGEQEIKSLKVRR